MAEKRYPCIWVPLAEPGSHGFSIPSSSEMFLPLVKSVLRNANVYLGIKPPVLFFQRERQVNELRTFCAKIGSSPYRKYCGHPIYFAADIEYILFIEGCHEDVGVFRLVVERRW
jgi:hypothetical protein